MENITGIIILPVSIIVVAILTSAIRRVKKYDLSLIKSRLVYLDVIPEVSWTVFTKNRVYIGFKKKIADMIPICRYAAVAGNKACGCSVRVYAVSAANGDYKTAERYGYAVASRGRITKNRPYFERV